MNAALLLHIKKLLISNRFFISDDQIVKYISENFDIFNRESYKKLIEDEDIKYYYADRIDNISKKIIWPNNIKMSEIKQQPYVNGILPTVTPQNSQDGPQPSTEYVSTKSPLNHTGMSNNDGSLKISSKSKGFFKDIVTSENLVYAVAIGGIVLIVLGLYESKKRKSKK